VRLLEDIEKVSKAPARLHKLLDESRLAEATALLKDSKFSLNRFDLR
jgi:hypothetical protein